MCILNEVTNLRDLFDAHQAAVKDNYKATSFETFVNHYVDNFEQGYIELSRSETISGQTEIISW